MIHCYHCSFDGIQKFIIIDDLYKQLNYFNLYFVGYFRKMNHGSFLKNSSWCTRTDRSYDLIRVEKCMCTYLYNVSSELVKFSFFHLHFSFWMITSTPKVNILLLSRRDPSFLFIQIFFSQNSQNYQHSYKSLVLIARVSSKI